MSSVPRLPHRAGVRPAAGWSAADAEALYHMAAWGEGYFGVNEAGHVLVRPERREEGAIDVYRVVERVRERGISLPALIRFQDVLHGRVVQLNRAFADAIAELGYDNRYIGVYPIKVNQLHEVVEEVLDAGREFGMGLECGSKSELVAAVAQLDDDGTLLLCNGYKDADMMRLILDAQRLDRQVVPILEKYDEFIRLRSLARERRQLPKFGVRVRLTTGGAGKWADSAGDTSKFGISIPELMKLVGRLTTPQQRESFVLLHFHLGSQVADILTLTKAVKEITQIYAQLVKRGIPLRYLDVGGGLGVSYDAAYAIGEDDGINYTLQEYANSVIYAVKEVCDAEGVAHPVVVSESGRAITAHHSLLVVEVLGQYGKDRVVQGFRPAPDDHAVVHQLYDSLQWVREEEPLRVTELLEAYHDAASTRQQSDSLFSLGYLPLEQKALAERLYWTVLHSINRRIRRAGIDRLPTELVELEAQLIDQYLCDFSVFQSMLDHWAIGQRFPIVPLHRLNEQPAGRALLVDLTCDSDGKVSGYVGSDPHRRFLDVHPLREGEPYFLGLFLMGAYQDIMGDAHNLFGRVAEVHVYADSEEPDGFYIEKVIPEMTVEEMLAMVQYFPNDLERRMTALLREKTEAGAVRPSEAVELLESYRKLFRLSTYFRSEHDRGGG